MNVTSAAICSCSLFMFSVMFLLASTVALIHAVAAKVSYFIPTQGKVNKVSFENSVCKCFFCMWLFTEGEPFRSPPLLASIFGWGQLHKCFPLSQVIDLSIDNLFPQCLLKLCVFLSPQLILKHYLLDCGATTESEHLSCTLVSEHVDSFKLC